MFFLWPLSKVLLDIKSRRLTTTVPVWGRQGVRGQGRHSGWVWWYIGLGVGLKLIALWLATLCKIGGMQCSELLKEFRNSFCFLPAALDFEQLFLLAHFLCARQSAANFYSILHSVCATLGFSGRPPSLLPTISLSFLTPHCFMHF